MDTEARRMKAIAVQKYLAGDLAGAKQFATNAKDLNPLLYGVKGLNALIDVKTGFRKKMNGGMVEWYAVLAVELTADVAIVKSRYRKLSNDMIFDNDDSLEISEATNILSECWKVLCINQKKRQVYDKKREIQLRVQNSSLSMSRVNQQVKRVSHFPSMSLSTSAPMVFSAPKPLVLLSSSEPSVEVKVEQMVQPPMGVSGQAVKSQESFDPPEKMLNEYKEEIIEVKVHQIDLLQMDQLQILGGKKQTKGT